jgi:hypothetical protein
VIEVVALSRKWHQLSATEEEMRKKTSAWAETVKARANNKTKADDRRDANKQTHTLKATKEADHWCGGRSRKCFSKTAKVAKSRAESKKDLDKQTEISFLDEKSR